MDFARVCARLPFPREDGGMNGVPLKMIRRGTLPPSAMTARQSVNCSFSLPAWRKTIMGCKGGSSGTTRKPDTKELQKLYSAVGTVN